MSDDKYADRHDYCAAPAECDRRAAVSILAGGLVGVVGQRHVEAADTSKTPPQDGDELVFAEGEQKGQLVTAAALPLDGPVAAAWAKDPATGVVRSGSKLYRILLIKPPSPAGFDDKTRARAADGIVAYSGFCTHAGCRSSTGSRSSR